jgi:hypothetical protein
MNLKKLQEIAKAKGKTLLIEDCEVSVKKEDIVLYTDKAQLVEAAGKPYPCRGILRNVPVTRFVENLNGRIYPKDLWERVLKEKMAENTLSLADHPDEDKDGSIKDITGVWKNFKVNENTGTADWYLVGDNGQLILETVNAGGKVGLSSVGFGEFREDGKTVIAETFELDRLADAVLLPSQKVYAAQENIETPPTPIQEKKEIKESMILTNKEINNEDSTHKREKNMLDKVQEANLKNQVRVAITEAKKSKKITEAIVSLKELKEILPDEMSDSKDKIDKATDELQAKAEAEETTAQADAEKKDKELADVQEKLKIATKSLEELSENYKKAQTILEKIKDIDPADHAQLLENEKLMKEDIDKLLEEKKKFQEEIKKLSAKAPLNEKAIKVVKILKERVKSQADKIKFAETHINELEEIMENELGYEFDGADEEKKDDKIVSEEDDGSDEDVVIDNDEEKKEEEVPETEPKEDEEEKIEEEDEKIVDTTSEKGKDDLEDLDDMDLAEDEDLDIAGKEDEDEKIEEDEEAKKDEEDDINIDEMAEELNAEETFDDIIEPKEDKTLKTAAKEAIRKKHLEQAAKTKRQIVSFYKEAVAKNPALKDVKQAILTSKSLLEASEKVFRFTSKKEGIIKVNKKTKVQESAPGWLGKRF